MSSTLPVLSVAALAVVRRDTRALLVDVCRPEAWAEGRLPGAVHVDYAALVRAEPPTGGLLPDGRALSTLVGALGLEHGRHLVAYDDEGGGKAARLLWTLYSLGYEDLSLLDGGRAAWLAGGGTLEPAAVVDPGDGTPGPALAPVRGVAERGWILAHLDDPEVVLLDTRTPAEFSGADRRAARGGHIPGAVNVDWTLTMDPDRHRALRPADELRALYAQAGVDPDAEVVAYCQTHHRSSHTFWVLRHLGYRRVRGYPGAWSDWGNRDDTPVEV